VAKVVGSNPAAPISGFGTVPAPPAHAPPPIVSAAVAEVRPLHALHYNLAAVGSLGDVTAPPYDVIEADQRRDLAARSPFNAVELDLPQAPGGADPYEHAAELLEEWTLQGILTGDRESAVWALAQDYTGPDGERRTRRGLLARVRVTEYGPGLIRPHERTHPGPREDRLRLTRATRHNLSPIFSLYEGDAWRHLEAALDTDPWGEATDADGTVQRVWRVAGTAIGEAVTEELADAELLIADGHHRYETARTYAEEIGGDGPHRYTLMCLVSLGDPGLTVFGTHRLIGGLAGDSHKQEALAGAIREHFELEEVGDHGIDPDGEGGVGVFGYIDSHSRRGFRLRLRDPSALDHVTGRSADYQRLDAVILEELILKAALGLSAEEIEDKRDLGYATTVDEALGQLADDGAYQAAFLLRPTPIEQVRGVAGAGETMPPKSTYFFPKVPTGIVFNPLS
jgi:uncharacterized protein (DUF1015 family)